MNKIMVFPRIGEFEKAKEKLEVLDLEYKIINPPFGYENFAIPSIVFSQEIYGALLSNYGGDFIFSGCVDYKPEADNTQEENKDNFEKDVFGKAYIMVISPCVADDTKVRLTAHLSEDIWEYLPYLNTYLKTGFYNHESKSITFMDGHRLITVYNNKIAIAKADGVTDTWRIIAKVRSLINMVNQNKNNITPSILMHRRPPALEIYSKLPKINCGECEQKTCMAFAFALNNGTANPFSCNHIFKGDYKHLQDVFMDICVRIGIGFSEDYKK